MRLRAISLLVSLLIGVASTAGAQRPHRAGFWWSVGVAPAMVDMSCDGCSELPDSIPYSPGPGFQVQLGAGGTMSPRLVWGLATTLAARTAGIRDATVANLGVRAQFYPTSSGPLFVQAGGGVSASSLAGGGTLIEAVGFGGNINIGFDLWRAGRLWISPYVGVMAAANGGKDARQRISTGDQIGPAEVPRALYLGAELSGY